MQKANYAQICQYYVQRSLVTQPSHFACSACNCFPV